MKIVENLSDKTINTEVKESIHKESTIHTDGYKPYNKLSEIIKPHCKYNLQYD